MRRPALRLTAVALTVLAGTGAAFARPLPFEESDYLPPSETTTYVERSLDHQAPLTIEHPPVAQGAGRGRAAMAGFCHEGGAGRRIDEAGRVVIRQREVCDNVAPRTLWPGRTDPRPAWPVSPAAYRRSLRVRG